MSKVFVIIRLCDFYPRYFFKKPYGISSLCSGNCLFMSEDEVLQHENFLKKSWSNTDFATYQIPENYSILGKTPIEFLTETQNYKKVEQVFSKPKTQKTASQKNKNQSALPSSATADLFDVSKSVKNLFEIY